MYKAISIDSHQIKPKVYTAGQSCQNTKNEMNQSEQEAKSHDPCQAREKKAFKLPKGRTLHTTGWNAWEDAVFLANQV